MIGVFAQSGTDKRFGRILKNPSCKAYILYMSHKTHHEDVGVLVVGWDAPATVKKLDALF